jgi:hypothetical protein
VTTTDGFQNELRAKLRQYPAHKFRTSAASLDYCWRADLPDRLHHCDARDRTYDDSHDHGDSVLNDGPRHVDNRGANRLLARLCLSDLVDLVEQNCER